MSNVRLTTIVLCCDALGCDARASIESASVAIARRIARGDVGWDWRGHADYCPEHASQAEPKARRVSP